jgi:hypothetical protein
VPRWGLELAVIYSIYRIYSYIRNLGGKDVEPAFRHGTAVLDLEKKLHIDVEMSLNRLGEHFTIVRDVASVHYHTLHWWMTIGTAAWLFITNKAGYRRGSFVLILTTLMALAGFYLMPTAPPRMYDGFVDTLAETSSWGWWSPSGSPGPDSLSNQFAAMPSLHCGWAIWCGLMIVLYAKRTWVRVLGALYPVSSCVKRNRGNPVITAWRTTGSRPSMPGCLMAAQFQLRISVRSPFMSLMSLASRQESRKRSSLCFPVPSS